MSVSKKISFPGVHGVLEMYKYTVTFAQMFALVAYYSIHLC